jgi:hypothetical protein
MPRQNVRSRHVVSAHQLEMTEREWREVQFIADVARNAGDPCRNANHARRRKPAGCAQRGEMLAHRSQMRAAELDLGDSLMLVDCSAAGFDDAPFARDGVNRDAMMRRIHARDAEGRWIRGIDVFAFAYRAAGFPRLARFLASRTLRSLLDRAYGFVADHRNSLSRLGLPWLFRLLTRRSCRDGA